VIITKTPFRISFFGGGTDHPQWFNEHGGKVLATTFDKYCYITVRVLPPFFEHSHRIVYSQIESVSDINLIEHPSVREVLKFVDFNKGLEIHHDGDLPARSGLGSSSSFTVGILSAMNALKGVYNSPHQLATEAIHIEQNLIKECVGSQDQISAAYGGFNEIEFNKDGSFLVEPLVATKERLEDLNNHLMLFFTGVSRYSSEILTSQLSNLSNCQSQMNELRDMVDEGASILRNKNNSLDDFGKLLDKSWKNKRSLSKLISNNKIDELYSNAIKAGALGGKILGAGGGGFILFFVKPENQINVAKTMKKLTYVSFKFENSGSKVVLYQPDGF
jgi:D-glycero-alpha-D-manno-heptose-7-phosphate kinase